MISDEANGTWVPSSILKYVEYDRPSHQSVMALAIRSSCFRAPVYAHAYRLASVAEEPSR